MWGISRRDHSSFPNVLFLCMFLVLFACYSTHIYSSFLWCFKPKHLSVFSHQDVYLLHTNCTSADGIWMFVCIRSESYKMMVVITAGFTLKWFRRTYVPIILMYKYVNPTVCWGHLSSSTVTNVVNLHLLLIKSPDNHTRWSFLSFHESATTKSDVLQKHTLKTV